MNSGTNKKKHSFRSLALFTWNGCATLIASPWIGVCKLESILTPNSHRIFHACGHFFALLPGFFGMSLRRAFYCKTLLYCSPKCHIGFGVLISDRRSILEDHVYVGNYALLGGAILREGCLIGSRASVLSQGDLHTLDESGHWVTPKTTNVTPTEVGAYSWIGEAAIIAAPVGRGARIAAGTVVASEVPAHIMVAGNPARFVRKLLPDDVPTAP